LQEALLLMPAGPERYWKRIETAPVGVAVRLIIANRSGGHHGHFPLPHLCRLTATGWINAATGDPLAVRPTRWQFHVETLPNRRAWERRSAKSPPCRRGNWPCGSPTPKAIFVSEASVYRLLKAHDLIASPAFIVMKAADEFKDKTTAPNQLWQTDFTYLKVVGWGWFYLSIVLDDFSRYIIAWKLCTTMKAEDVTATLEMALEAAGLDKARVLHRPRLLSDNGSSYISGDLAKWLKRHDMGHVRGAPYHQ
jgi:transposase InsO family protein